MSEIWNFDSLKALMDERYEHQKELRLADQKAIDIALQRTNEHFEQLNENAKRTIEERGHFVSIEAFDPFRDRVNQQLDTQEGQAKGSQLTKGNVYASIISLPPVFGGLVGWLFLGLKYPNNPVLVKLIIVVYAFG